MTDEVKTGAPSRRLPQYIAALSGTLSQLVTLYAGRVFFFDGIVLRRYSSVTNTFS